MKKLFKGDLIKNFKTYLQVQKWSGTPNKRMKNVLDQSRIHNEKYWNIEILTLWKSCHTELEISKISLWEKHQQ